MNIIQADTIYALIEFVTFKMYHLSLTLGFIFADPSAGSEITADQVRKKELLAAVLCIASWVI